MADQFSAYFTQNRKDYAECIRNSLSLVIEWILRTAVAVEAFTASQAITPPPRQTRLS